MSNYTTHSHTLWPNPEFFAAKTDVATPNPRWPPQTDTAARNGDRTEKVESAANLTSLKHHISAPPSVSVCLSVANIDVL